jgi:exo-beta-1,3-glucanase (GH17 family)
MMKYFAFLLFTVLFISCKNDIKPYAPIEKNAAELLGNTNYKAICYSGYKSNTRDKEPTIPEIKDDLMLLHALNFKIIRTYNVHFKQTENILEAINQLKKENPKFEMYVMLGAWIDCKNAWTNKAPIHNQESNRNKSEILEAVRLSNKYSKIVKIIAVGNESMVKWATNYYVTPNIILKWVNFLQNLKTEKKLPKNLWITSSDNFAAWGGGDSSYHTNDLKNLYKAVDYISLHTYPMHDTYYNPNFWGVYANEKNLSKKEQINKAMLRAKDYAVNQYNGVKRYMKTLQINKPIHIGETGWATISNEQYGNNGTKATDEYKAALYYNLIQNWCTKNKITCFYFEAFDENWKNNTNANGTENHFGLINLKNQAKYVLWKAIDDKTLQNITRNGKPLTKTYQGKEALLWKDVTVPNAIKQ